MQVDQDKKAFKSCKKLLKECVGSWRVLSGKFQAIGLPQKRPDDRTLNTGDAVSTAGGTPQIADAANR